MADEDAAVVATQCAALPLDIERHKITHARLRRKNWPKLALARTPKLPSSISVLERIEGN